MVSARNKIHKPTGQEPDELENAVAQALFDLESVAEIKADIMPLQFNAAKEVKHLHTPLLSQRCTRTDR